MFQEFAKKVIAEIKPVFDSVKDQQVSDLVRDILAASQIIVGGAGRVGFACRGFAMRLGHLGMRSFSSGDSTLPHVGQGDLLILGSSSGETQTVYDIAVLGKKNGARVVVITANPDSPMGKLADAVIMLNAPTKFGPREGSNSIQPMASLFEQSLQIFFDCVVLLLMKDTEQSHDDLWARHANLD
jgi:6-phospho-3-hexuloisomerase